MTDKWLAEYVKAANMVPENRRGVLERVIFALQAERVELEAERSRYEALAEGVRGLLEKMDSRDGRYQLVHMGAGHQLAYIRKWVAQLLTDPPESPWVKFDPEDEGTWPEDGQYVMCGHDPKIMGIWPFIKAVAHGWAEIWWRPLTPLDRPPVEQEGE